MLLTGLLIFFYVGSEVAIGGWISSYAKRLSMAPRLWPLAQSAFWVGILLGRLAAPIVLRRIAGPRLVLSSLLLTSAGVALFLAGQNGISLFAGVVLAGLGCASIFPTAIAIFSEHAGPQAHRLVAFVFVLGGLGGASIPWLVGYLSAQLDSLRAALSLALLCTLIMIVLQLRIISVLARAPVVNTNAGEVR